MSKETKRHVPPCRCRKARWGWLLGGMMVWCVCGGYTWKGRGGKKNDPSKHPPYLALARLALQAHDQAAAVRVLEAARRCWEKQKRACGFERHEYLMLAGILYLESRDAKRAILLLQAAQVALSKTSKQPLSRPVKWMEAMDAVARENLRKEQKQREKRLHDSLWFYLGQAFYRAGRHREAAEALVAAASVGRKMSGYYGLLSRAWAQAGEAQKSHKVIEKGLSLFPKDSRLLREAALLYAKNGFFQSATSFASQLSMLDPKAALQVWIVLIDQMQQEGASLRTLSLLEELNLRFPQSEALLLRRCVGFAKTRLHRASAECFALLAQKRPEMAYYAAAAYLQAGQLFLALRWNARVPDAKRRILQRASLFLMQREYARVFALLWPLWMRGQLGEAERYRLAYAALQIGRYQASEKLLVSLEGTPFSSMGTALRHVIGRCRSMPWLCVR